MAGQLHRWANCLDGINGKDGGLVGAYYTVNAKLVEAINDSGCNTGCCGGNYGGRCGSNNGGGYDVG